MLPDAFMLGIRTPQVNVGINDYIRQLKKIVKSQDHNHNLHNIEIRLPSAAYVVE